MHGMQFDHACLDLLSLIIWSRVFWPFVMWNLRKAHWTLEQKCFDLWSLSPTLHNLWLLLVIFIIHIQSFGTVWIDINVKLSSKTVTEKLALLSHKEGNVKRIYGMIQHAKEVVSDSLGLVDFATGLVNSVLNLPNGQVIFLGEFKLQRNCNQSCSSIFFQAS